ncbi:MAG: mannose-6-phosphate isomerase, class I [Saprospiraceae bacterium]
MDLDHNIFPLTGVIQNYAWGGTVFIPELLGIKNETQQPYAELWMGTHTRGPATVSVGGKTLPLGALIAAHPEAILGAPTVAEFGPQLPFLFKVLAVKKMLSIQVHPTKAAAEIGFAKENELGIPLSAPHRNYKDDNHKPEIMVAMSDFWLLHGFKSKVAIAASLAAVPELKELLTFFQAKTTLALYQYLMELPQAAVNQILKPLANRLATAFQAGKLQKSAADYWAALAFQENNLPNGDLDRGIFSIYLFNLVFLKKGEAIFQDAGIPHAYLEGINIELMANSDNVFRGGLTVKHIDVPALMQHLRTDAIVPHIIQAAPISATEKLYACPAIDFTLSQIVLQQGQVHEATENPAPAVLIVLEGTVWVSAGNQKIKRTRGESFFAAAEVPYQIETEGSAVLYKASVPV